MSCGYKERLEAAGGFLNGSCTVRTIWQSELLEEWIVNGGKVIVSVMDGTDVAFKAVGCFVRHGASVTEREDLTGWTSSLDEALAALEKINKKETVA